MVIVRPLQSRDQDFINSKLRPHKRKFPRGPIAGAQLKMRSYGRHKLRSYRPQAEYRHPTYYHLDLERDVINYQVPRLGKIVRITDTQGNPIVLGKRRIRSQKFRIQYQKQDYDDQLASAFEIYNHCIRLLEEVIQFFKKNPSPYKNFFLRDWLIALVPGLPLPSPHM